MSPTRITLTNGDKILLTLLEMSSENKRIRYEDLVVRVFKKYPTDFHLKGYPEYPDSGDMIHKPLYDFRKKGYLEANSKIFTLTDLGLSQAEKLKSAMDGRPIAASERTSRFAEREVKRIQSLEGLGLFLAGEKEKINDTDFFSYLGVSPMTSKNDFVGRISTIEKALEEFKSDISENLKAYHSFLLGKFSNVVNHYKSHDEDD